MPIIILLYYITMLKTKFGIEDLGFPIMMVSHDHIIKINYVLSKAACGT